MVIKDEGKAGRIKGQIIRETGREDIQWYRVDLSRKGEIFHFASRITEPVNVLVNNAAIAPRYRQETPEGIEMELATNVLGYYWMIQAFTGHLKQAAPSRVVNVASYWAGDMDFSDLEFKHRRYNNDTAYRQSKQADRMLTVAFAEKLASYGISVNACHPGDVNSKLSNDLGYGGHESPDQGAMTPVFLATSPEVAESTGKYFADRREVYCQFSRDKKGIERLFEICSQY